MFHQNEAFPPAPIQVRPRFSVNSAAVTRQDVHRFQFGSFFIQQVIDVAKTSLPYFLCQNLLSSSVFRGKPHVTLVRGWFGRFPREAFLCLPKTSSLYEGNMLQFPSRYPQCLSGQARPAAVPVRSSESFFAREQLLEGYCGWLRNPCRTTLKLWETIAGWYLQANFIISGSLR